MLKQPMTLKLSMEGPSSQAGHLELDALARQLERVVRALRGVEKASVGKSAHKYRVVGLSYASPYEFALDAVAPRTDVAPPPFLVFDKMSELAQAAESDEEPPEWANTTAIGLMHEVTKQVGKAVASCSLSDDASSLSFDEALRKGLKRWVSTGSIALGEVRGMLEALNTHGDSPRFWIYPPFGPSRVRCDVKDEGLLQEVLRNVRRDVTVRGELHYREGAVFPSSVKAKSIETHEEELGEIYFSDLRGTDPMAGGDLPAEEIVRKLRDEWH